MLKLIDICHSITRQVFSSSVKLSFNGNEFTGAEINGDSFSALQLAIIKPLQERKIIADKLKINFSAQQNNGESITQGHAAVRIIIETDLKTVSFSKTGEDVIWVFIETLISAINKLIAQE